MSTEDLIGFAIVFVIAMGENIAAIPIGLLMGLDPLGVVISASAGALAMMLIALVVGDRIWRWLQKDSDRAERMGSMRERAGAKLDRFGAPGLALVGPLVLGVHVGTVLAMMLGMPKGKITLWMGIGIVGVAIVVTIVSEFLGGLF